MTPDDLAQMSRDELIQADPDPVRAIGATESGL